VIFLSGPSTTTVANVIVAQMLFLERKSGKDISLYINSPGGIVTSRHGDLRHHAIHQAGREHDLRRPGASMGACCSLPRQASAMRCRIRAVMIHQPLGGFRASDRYRHP
jgi:ATP-dependent Clp protease protease subunit